MCSSDLLETDVEKVCKKIEDKVYSKSVREKVQEDICQIKDGEFITKIDKYFDCFYEKTATLLDYLSEDCIVFIDEIAKIKARAENIAKDNDNLIKDLIEKNKIVPGILTKMQDYLKFSEQIPNKQIIYLEKQDVGFVDKQSMHAKRNGYSFSYREVNFFRSSMDLLFQKLQKAINSSKQTVNGVVKQKVITPIEYRMVMVAVGIAMVIIIPPCAARQIIGNA